MRQCLIAAAAAWTCLAGATLAGGLTGPYAGVIAGYGVAATTYSPLLHGALAGVRLGYGGAAGALLWGIEGQASVAAVQGDETMPGFVTVLGGSSGPTSLGGGTTAIGPSTVGSALEHLVQNSDWQIDLTGRLGRYLGATSVYFLGGVSAANDRLLDTETVKWTGTPPAHLGAHAPISASAIHLGIVGGAGIETTLSDLSIFAEARYHHYFSTAYNFSNGAVAVEPFSAASISTGLDWHF